MDPMDFFNQIAVPPASDPSCSYLQGNGSSPWNISAGYAQDGLGARNGWKRNLAALAGLTCWPGILLLRKAVGRIMESNERRIKWLVGLMNRFNVSDRSFAADKRVCACALVGIAYSFGISA